MSTFATQAEAAARRALARVFAEGKVREFVIELEEIHGPGAPFIRIPPILRWSSLPTDELPPYKGAETRDLVERVRPRLISRADDGRLEYS